MKDFTCIKTNILVLGSNLTPTLWNIYQSEKHNNNINKRKNQSSVKPPIYSMLLFYQCLRRFPFQLTLSIYKEIPRLVTSWQRPDMHSGPLITEVGCGILQLSLWTQVLLCQCHFNQLGHSHPHCLFISTQNSSCSVYKTTSRVTL